MSKKYFYFLMFAALTMILVFAFGCSDDDKTTSSTSDWSNANFANFDELIEEIAPEVYVTPTAAPSDWTTGEVPLLGKVLGNEEPMALYTNLDNFTEMTSQMENFILRNDAGEFMLDTTHTSGDSAITNYVTFSALTGATDIPTEMQTLFGDSLNLDYLVEMNWPEMGDNDIAKVAFKANDTTQTMLLYMVQAETELITCSNIYYGCLTLADSSVVMKGMTYKDYGNGYAASWMYNINSVNESEFAYKMSWYSNESEEFTLLGCIIGGGDASDEFALQYREYNPADSADYKDETALEQVFNADYTAGTSLISSFSTYLDEAYFFLYDDMPTGLLVDPWAEE